MTNRDNAAVSADNSTADNLDGDDFLWGSLADGDDNDSGIVTSGEQLSDADIAADGHTETSEGLEGQQQGEDGGEAPAARQGQQPPANAAGTPPQAPAQQQAQTPPAQAAQPAAAPVQAPTSEQPQQRAPLFHEMVNANFDTAVDHVAAQPAFKLSPQDAEAIGDPAIATLMEKQSAKVFLRAMSGFSEMLHNTLPTVVHSLIGINTEGKSVADQFYSENGFTREHEQQLVQIAGFLRTQNPKIDRQTLMRETARMGHAMLGTQPPAPKAPAATAAPGKPNGQRVVSRQAFTPAAKTPGGGAPQARRVPGQAPARPDPIADMDAMLRSTLDFE